MRTYRPEGHSNCQSPETIRPTPDVGLSETLDTQIWAPSNHISNGTGPLMYEDWTPDSRGLDPRCTRTGPPMYEDWTPDVRGLDPQYTSIGPLMHMATGPSIPQTRTLWDSGLRGIQGFVGFRTSWDSGLRGIQDFAGSRTSWDRGPNRKRDPLTHLIRILFCGVLSENTNFQDKNSIKWTELGLRLVDSVLYVCFISWLFHEKTLPRNFTEPSNMQFCDINVPYFVMQC